MSIPQTRANLAFQTEALYERPTWPAMILDALDPMTDETLTATADITSDEGH